MRTSIIDIFIFIDISRLKYMIWTVLKNGYEPFLKLFQSHFCQTIQRLDDKVLLRPRFRRLYGPWMTLWLYSLWCSVNAFVFVVDLREAMLQRKVLKHKLSVSIMICLNYFEASITYSGFLKGLFALFILMKNIHRIELNIY